MNIVANWRHAAVIAACLHLAGCTDLRGAYQHHSGATMGTQYRVTAVCPVDVGAEIARQVEWVNAEMSTYDPASTLSRFNQSAPGDWFAVSPELAELVAAAEQLSRDSGGAFDVTVGPLVNLWGFGPDGYAGTRPEQAQIDAARDRVGYTYLEVRALPPALRKSVDVYVDLSAIAKGYGVDRVAQRLAQLECTNYLVEIGGELKAHGVNEHGHPWRVGVEVPDPESYGAVQRVLYPGELGVATSGDYRNFVEDEAGRFSHTIDPRTGYPVSHRLASVTVAHASTMWADGYATLLDVLGPDSGFEFAQRHGLPAMFIVRTENGFEERYTDQLEPLLGNE